MPTLLLIAGVQLFCFLTLSIKWIKKKENPIHYIKKYPLILLFTVIGILSNYLFFVYALRLVPEIEASLINYLWPMFTVFFSALLPDHKLRSYHILGVILGFTGIVILIWNPELLSINFSLGQAIALLGAVLWAIYSIITRYFKETPSDLVTITFFINFWIMLFAHLLFEERWVINQNDLFFVMLLGVTAGIAYYYWDKGMKIGNIQFIATAANFTPLFSTMFLIGFGVTTYTNNIALATILILTGTLISSKETILALIKNYHKYS